MLPSVESEGQKVNCPKSKRLLFCLVMKVWVQASLLLASVWSKGGAEMCWQPFSVAVSLFGNSLSPEIQAALSFWHFRKFLKQHYYSVFWTRTDCFWWPSRDFYSILVLILYLLSVVHHPAAAGWDGFQNCELTWSGQIRIWLNIPKKWDPV